MQLWRPVSSAIRPPAAMHQVRAVSLSSYVAVASQLGIDGNGLLAAAQIRRSDLEDGEAWLPAGAVMGLLERSAEVSGCDSFGIRMAQGRSFASRGPVSLLLQHLETVGEVVDASILFRRNFGDVAFVALAQEKDVALIHIDLIPPYNTPHAADLAIATGYLTLVGASNGRWAPEAVHFTHQAPKDRVPFEKFFGVPLEFGSSFNGLSCSSESLRIPLPLADRAMASNARRLLEYETLPAERATMSDHTRHSIGLMLASGHATLEDVAANLNQNGRSLQRNLEIEGDTFGDLLNQVRRGLAQQYLAGSTQPIIEISDILGYTAPTSFSRWFLGEFGSSPKDWRAAQLKTAAGLAAPWHV